MMHMLRITHTTTKRETTDLSINLSLYLSIYPSIHKSQNLFFVYTPTHRQHVHADVRVDLAQELLQVVPVEQRLPLLLCHCRC